MLFSLGGTTSCRVADTDDTGLEVVTACQPVQKTLAGWRLPSRL